MHGFYPRPMHRMHPYMPYSRPQWPVNPSPPPQHGATGFLKQLLGQSNAGAISLEGVLDKVQRTLNLAEQITPMIQQYGPLIRNAPALIQLLKETAAEGNQEEEETDTEEKTDNPKAEGASNKKASSNEQNRRQRQTQVPKESVPKLYI